MANVQRRAGNARHSEDVDDPSLAPAAVLYTLMLKMTCYLDRDQSFASLDETSARDEEGRAGASEAISSEHALLRLKGTHRSSSSLQAGAPELCGLRRRRDMARISTRLSTARANGGEGLTGIPSLLHVSTLKNEPISKPDPSLPCLCVELDCFTRVGDGLCCVLGLEVCE